MSDQENHNPVVRVVPVGVNEDWQAPAEWKLNAINDVVVDGKVQFYAVIIKPQKPVMPPSAIPEKTDPKL